MAVKMSLISLLILLLSIGSYSLPIEQLNDDSTVADYQYTTISTAAHHEDEIQIELISNQESTNISNDDNQKPFDKLDSNESTTPDQFEYPEDVSLPSSTFDDFLLTSSSVISTTETTLSNFENDENTSLNNVFTTVEAVTQAEESSITSDNNRNDVELSTVSNDNSLLINNQVEQTTAVESLIVESETHVSEESSLIKAELETSSVVESELESSSTTQYESNTSEQSSSAEIESVTSSFIETKSEISSTTDSESDVSSNVESESNILTESSSIETESEGSLSTEIESQTSELSSSVDDSSENSTLSNDNDQSEEKSTKSDNDKNAHSNEQTEVLTTSDSTEQNQVDLSIEEDESNE